MTGIVFILALAVLPVAIWLAWGHHYDPPDEAPPDWGALHLEQFARFVPPPCHPGCVAHNDQAVSEFAGWLGELGVDLDDPHQLHAVLAALSIATRQALYRPLHAGGSLGCHVNALAVRISGGGRGE